MSAERASTELKEQARREADLILGEAHVEARKVRRDATAENERLISASRKIKAQLRAALEMIDDVQDAEDAPATKDDGQNTWPGEREAA
jgi:cell division septum initiation protein DivIVA